MPYVVRRPAVGNTQTRRKFLVLCSFSAPANCVHHCLIGKWVMGEGKGVCNHIMTKASTGRRTGWSASIYECASRGEHAAETTEVRLIGSGGGERTSYPRVACSGNSIHGDHNNDIITFGYT